MLDPAQALARGPGVGVEPELVIALGEHAQGGAQLDDHSGEFRSMIITICSKTLDYTMSKMRGSRLSFPPELACSLIHSIPFASLARQLARQREDHVKGVEGARGVEQRFDFLTRADKHAHAATTSTSVPANAKLTSVIDPARKIPTLADLEALPRNVKGEIIEGVLYTMTRPRGPHQRTALAIGGDLRGPFDNGRSGPGGWWILPEPGIELPDTPEISPDVAGWRRERLVVLPYDAPIRIAPDWVCEILSPTTRRHDLLVKKPYYARVGVSHHWLIDLDARTLTAYRLESGRWLELGIYADDHEARIEPFDAVSLDVASWWP